MRRLFTVVTAALTSLFVLALPALATTGSGSDAGGFGSSQGDAMLLTAIIGVIFGVGVLIDAYAGQKDEHHGPGPGEHL